MGQWASDGFLPTAVSSFLYTEYFHVGPAAVNGWSAVHAVSGVLASFLTPQLVDAFMIHSAWELFQFVIGDNKFDAETVVDVTLDTLFFMLGFEFAVRSDPPSKWWLLLFLLPVIPP